MKLSPIIMSFAAGAMCGAAAIAMTDDSTMRKIRRKAGRTVRTIGTVASDIADLVK